jgi:hypothetical protein
VPSPRDAGASIDAGLGPGLYLHAASRCGDCHDKMFDEWQASAHSRSASAPAFLPMRAAATDGAACDVCHRPLARYAAPRALAADGVTCDVCHTLRAVDPAAAMPRFALEVGQPVKYGPYCQLGDHYFHRMGCSPLHRRSELCAACHQLEADGVPIYTSYREWQGTRYARRGVQCQDCHMPSVRAPIAEGAAARERIGDHRLAVPAGPGLAFEATARAAGDAIEVRVMVESRGAGHHLPTGSPERRLVVSVRALDAAGGEVARVEAAFGRVLVDADGRPAPHALAVREAEDTRIPAGGRAVRLLRLDRVPREGALRVELVRRRLDPEIARLLGVDPPGDEVLLTAELPFGAARRARDLARRVRGRP